MGVATRRNTVGVVGEITDTFKRHPEPFGDELREAGFMSLSRGHRAHHQLDLAFRKHSDFGALARGAAGDLDIIGDADTSGEISSTVAHAGS
jgi:hypothetical protein